MKKVVIFGAAGHTGKYITEKMKSEKDIELSVFVRNPDKLFRHEINVPICVMNIICADHRI